MAKSYYSCNKDLEVTIMKCTQKFFNKIALSDNDHRKLKTFDGLHHIRMEQTYLKCVRVKC